MVKSTCRSFRGLGLVPSAHMEVHREYAHEVPKADPVLRDLNKSSSELAHLEQAHQAGYNNPHSLPVFLFNSFKSSGWISWPSPLAFPVSLRICDGVLESTPEQRCSSSRKLGWVGIGCGRRVWCACWLCKKGSSGPALSPHVSGQASF